MLFSEFHLYHLVRLTVHVLPGTIAGLRLVSFFINCHFKTIQQSKTSTPVQFTAAANVDQILVDVPVSTNIYASRHADFVQGSALEGRPAKYSMTLSKNGFH